MTRTSIVALAAAFAAACGGTTSSQRAEGPAADAMNSSVSYEGELDASTPGADVASLVRKAALDSFAADARNYDPSRRRIFACWFNEGARSRMPLHWRCEDAAGLTRAELDSANLTLDPTELDARSHRVGGQ